MSSFHTGLVVSRPQTRFSSVAAAQIRPARLTGIPQRPSENGAGSPCGQPFTRAHSEIAITSTYGTEIAAIAPVTSTVRSLVTKMTGSDESTQIVSAATHGTPLERMRDSAAENGS